MPLQAAKKNNEAAKLLSIRLATPKDIDIITQWTIKLHQHENDGELKMHSNFNINLKKWLATELVNPNSLFLFAEFDNSPVGFIFSSSVINDNGFLASNMKGVIHLLWVEHSSRNRNIAGMLLNEVETCLSAIGISYIECNYTNHNNIAQSFWDKNGYKKASITARKIL
jgi:diamine N-acetyltransferase